MMVYTPQGGFSMTSQELDKAVLRLMNGAIDMHIHIDPESRLKRRQDSFQLAKTAKEYGMKAIILKNREYGTVALARLVQDLVPEVKVFGSFTMDNEAGGFNPGAVLAWIKMGAKVIWMPTATAANSKGKVFRSRGLDLPGEGQTVTDDKGKLKPVVKEILKIIKDNDVILGTGHISPEEHFVLVKEALKMGIKNVVLTHVHQDQLIDKILTDAEIIRLVKLGAWVEYSFWTCQNNIYSTSPSILADSIKKVGAEHCIMTTDFGQIDNPPAPEGLKLFITAMLQNGIPEKDVETMVKKNPAQLLKLE
jgi:microsomal dipeptidase-like Zn-dependent dipeptidase